MTTQTLEPTAPPTAPPTALVRAVLDRGIAIDANDEGDIDAGTQLFALGADGRLTPVGIVTLVRQHRTRADWSAIMLDRQSGLLRGARVVVGRAAKENDTP